MEYPEGRSKREGAQVGNYHCIAYYSTHAVTLEVHVRQCVNGNPQCNRVWSGNEQCLHRVSSRTAVGWEVGHLFDVQVLDVKSANETGFCVQRNKVYEYAGCGDLQFCSPRTFRDFHYGWSSRHHREFRRVCPACPKDPVTGETVCQALGGDGTAVSYRLDRWTGALIHDGIGVQQQLDRVIKLRCFIQNRSEKVLSRLLLLLFSCRCLFLFLHLRIALSYCYTYLFLFHCM